MAKSKVDIKSENDLKIYENSTFAVSAKDINDVNASTIDAMVVDGENLGEDASSHGVFAGKDVNGGTDEGVLAFKSIRATGAASVSSNSEHVTINVPQSSNPATEFGLYYEPFLDQVNSNTKISGYVSRIGSMVKITGRIQSDVEEPLQLECFSVVPKNFGSAWGARWLRLKEVTMTSNGTLNVSSGNLVNNYKNGFLTLNKISSYVAGNVSTTKSRLYMSGKILGTTRSYEIDNHTLTNYSDFIVDQPSPLAFEDADITASQRYDVVDRVESANTSGGSFVSSGSGSQQYSPSDYYLGSPLDLTTTALNIGYDNDSWAVVEDDLGGFPVPSTKTDISFVLHFDLY